MSQLSRSPVWRKRFKSITRKFDELRLPRIKERISQDREWCIIKENGQERKVRLHDYDRIYRIPGAYEEIFYNTLRCCSPSYVVNLLQSVIDESGYDISELRVLDVGAGNGMVGDELLSRGVKQMIGIDLIPEAKEAAFRDRPGLYSDYFIADLTDFPAENESKIRASKLNCMTTVAALGFGDIPPPAFLKALEMLETPAWLGFNINEKFLKYDETSGFSRLIRFLSSEEYLLIDAYRRYRHRLAVNGNPIYYVAVAARKLKKIPDAVMVKWNDK